MAPTIQTNGNASERDKRTARPAEKRSELICRVKYCNTLPDIPFDPKFITYPFESTRFIQYNPTSLERNYKYEVLTEHDLGVEIDLINKDTYAGDVNAQLDPADEKLLEEDVLTPQDSKRSRHHARSVSWLRRTEYISTEQTRFQPQTVDKVEAKVGYSIKKNFKEETLYMDRESQIKAIEKTFEDNKKSIERHYSKPNVVPVEILPVFPDFKLWKYPCAQVIFDSDPAPTGRSVPAQIEEMSQAMIRGVMDESGEQFVAYFLPLEETLEKRRRDFTAGIDYADDEEYEYKMAREYNWNVKSKASKGYEENYFLVIRQDGVYYNELETRVRLSKRRQKVGQQPNNTRLIVRHRPLNANEFKMQRYREKQLEPPGEEDEDEEEEEEEEEEPQQEVEKTEEREESDNEDASRRSPRSSSEGYSDTSRSESRSPSRSPSKSLSRSDSAESRNSSNSPEDFCSKSVSKYRASSTAASNSSIGSPAKSRASSTAASNSSIGSPAKSRASSTAASNSSIGSPAKSRASSTAASNSSIGSPAKSRASSTAASNSSIGSPAKSRASSTAASNSCIGSPAKSRASSTAASKARTSSFISQSESLSPPRSRSPRSQSPSRSQFSSGSRTGSDSE